MTNSSTEVRTRRRLNSVLKPLAVSAQAAAAALHALAALLPPATAAAAVPPAPSVPAPSEGAAAGSLLAFCMISFFSLQELSAAETSGAVSVAEGAASTSSDALPAPKHRRRPGCPDQRLKRAIFSTTSSAYRKAGRQAGAEGSKAVCEAIQSALWYTLQPAARTLAGRRLRRSVSVQCSKVVVLLSKGLGRAHPPRCIALA